MIEFPATFREIHVYTYSEQVGNYLAEIGGV